MARQFIIAPSASQDLDRIADYYLSRDSVEAGEKLFQEFQKKCQYLTQFPNIGRSYGHIIPGLRGTPLNGHIILYEVTESLVVILHVVNGRQDLEALLLDQ
jgi:toxin ParE1/3/4